MARKTAVRKRYESAAELAAAAREYFASISRLVPVKERIPTGRKDEYGHDEYKLVSVKNRLGLVVKAEEWILPPSVPELCRYIGVTREQWDAMRGSPEFGAAVRAAEERVEGYLRRELLTRPGKDVKGVVLTLQADHGYGRETGGGGESLEELLRRMAEEKSE